MNRLADAVANTVIKPLLDVVQWVFAIAVTFAIPALFKIAVWVTNAAVGIYTNTNRRMLSEGLIVLLSMIGWAAIALLATPLLLVAGATMPAAFIGAAIAGGIWGLCVGYQVSQQQAMLITQQPQLDPARHFGLPSHFYTATTEPIETISADELLQQGVVLGEDVRWTVSQ